MLNLSSGFSECKSFLFVSALLIFSCFTRAQDSLEQKASLSWSLFIDAYYSYDFNKPGNHEKAGFIYNHNRHNEFNINLVLGRISYSDKMIRANLGLMAGTYPQYNLASEPQMLRHIYEANLGIKLSRKKQLWIDAGILPSHIGFETAISKDCWTLTRSIVAENTPYYETGLRVSYKTKNDKWYLAGMVLNGWQRIRRIEGNNTPAFGTQLTYTPSDKLSFNSSAFVGNDKPDSAKRWRYYNNLYSIWQISKAWGITIGFDAGLEQKVENSSDLNSWYSPILILRFQKNGWTLAGRAEYYSDRWGVIIPLINTAPCQMQGYSLNADRLIGTNMIWRIEGRWLKNATPYFSRESLMVVSDISVTTSLCISL